MQVKAGALTQSPQCLRQGRPPPSAARAHIQYMQCLRWGRPPPSAVGRACTHAHAHARTREHDSLTSNCGRWMPRCRSRRSSAHCAGASPVHGPSPTRSVCGGCTCRQPCNDFEVAVNSGLFACVRACGEANKITSRHDNAHSIWIPPGSAPGRRTRLMKAVL